MFGMVSPERDGKGPLSVWRLHRCVRVLYFSLTPPSLVPTESLLVSCTWSDTGVARRPVYFQFWLWFSFTTSLNSSPFFWCEKSLRTLLDRKHFHTVKVFCESVVIKTLCLFDKKGKTSTLTPSLFNLLRKVLCPDHKPSRPRSLFRTLKIRKRVK